MKFGSFSFKPIVVLDLETVPYSEAASVWKPKLNPDGTVKDPNEFPPIYVHKICTIGAMIILQDRIEFGAFQWEHENPNNSIHVTSQQKSEHCVFHKTEKEILIDFLHNFLGELRFPIVSDSRIQLVTQNGEGFDIPVMICRMMRYGMNISAFHCPDLSFDLTKMYFGVRGPSLNAASKIIGLPGKMEIDGTSVKTLFDNGSYLDIASYCLTDVFQTALVFLKMRSLMVPPALDGCDDFDNKIIVEYIRAALRSSKNTVLNTLHDRINWDIYCEDEYNEPSRTSI